MLPGGEEFHQPVAAEPLVQRKGQPHHYRGVRHPEEDAGSLPDTRRVQDDEHHEHGKQAGGKNEKVLGAEAFKLDLAAHAFIYFKI